LILQMTRSLIISLYPVLARTMFACLAEVRNTNAERFIIKVIHSISLYERL